MLTDKTYFIGIITVPGILSVNSGTDFEADLTILIQKYEKEFLRRIFGIEMYLEYVADTNPVVSGSKWDKLINGTQYTDIFGNVNLWDGLIRTAPKASAIANYIFVKYMKNKISETLPNGERFNEVENSQGAAIENKVVPAWNEMVNMNKEMDLFLKSYTVGGVLQFPDYRSFSYGMWNDLDYNIEPDFILRLIRTEPPFLELFNPINSLNF